MRRVILALFGTVAGLVGLLTFKTHPVLVASQPVAVSTDLPGSTTTAAGTPDTTAAGASTRSATAKATTSATAKATTSATAKAAPASTAKATTTTKTVTGNSIDTRWGPVQVRIVVTNGKLSSVTAVDYPQNNGRDQEINAAAIPALGQEALAAGNAKIDMISGATYTSTGYIDSLQSALDKAGL